MLDRDAASLEPRQDDVQGADGTPEPDACAMRPREHRCRLPRGRGGSIPDLMGEAHWWRQWRKVGHLSRLKTGPMGAEPQLEREALAVGGSRP
jgi:hypothetical protein